MPGGDKVLALFQPFLMYFFHRSFYFFIWAHAINTAHEDVSEYGAIGSSGEHFQIDMEAGITFQLGQIDGNNRNLFPTCLFQSSADKSDIIGRTASATGLRHQNGNPVQVILSGSQRIHNLSDDPERRIACIIIYIFKSHIDGILVVILHDNKIVTAGAHCAFQYIEMNR